MSRYMPRLIATFIVKKILDRIIYNFMSIELKGARLESWFYEPSDINFC